MPYIGTSPSNGVRRVHTYTATASQTTFTGASSEGVTLSYADTNYIDVFQNGVLLGNDDYTATSGTSVVLSQSASLSDLVVIIVYDVFSVADTVSKTNGGTFDGAVTFGGGVSGNIANVSGDMTIDVAGDITLDADGGDVIIKDGGSSIGAITNISSDLSIYSLTGNHKGLRFGNGQIVPTNNSGADSDNTTDLGGTSNRFKNLYLSGGAYIGGTDSANLLDDYEEGTFTATMTGSTSNPNSTIQDTSAYYTKIGRQVWIVVNFINVDTTGASGSVIITGLPFASLASSGDAYVSGNVAWYKRMALNSNVDQVAVEIGQGASQFSFICSSSGNAWTDAVHSAGNNFYLRASATYPTAS